MRYKLLTLEEVADFIGVKPRHLQNLRKDDGFPAPVKVGKTRVRYRSVDIEKWCDDGGVKDDK